MNEADSNVVIADGKTKNFRLMVVGISWDETRSMLKWAQRLRCEHGLLTILYGIDIWINGIPLIRTLIAANILVWIILWLAR